MKGIIIHNRVSGNLAVTRALGDLNLKREVPNDKLEIIKCFIGSDKYTSFQEGQYYTKG